MSSVGFGLIKSVIENNVQMSELTSEGVGLDKLLGQETSAYQFVTNHFMEHGVYPQVRTVEAEIGEGIFSNLPNEPTEYWVEKVKERWTHNLLVNLRDRIQDELHAGHTPDNAVAILNEIHSRINSDRLRGSVTDMFETQREVLEIHDRVQQMSVIPGVPFGIPFLDNVSGGMQAGDLIVAVGESGVGKTYLTLAIGRAARESGHSVLGICTEMLIQQIARRDLAMKGGIDSSELKLGRVSAYARSRLVDLINESENRTNENSYYKLLPSGIFGTYDDIAAATKELKPKLLVVDGASLIRIPDLKSSRWDKIIEVLSRFKNLAMQEDDLRILMTFHYGKDGPGDQKNIYGGLAISQFASIILSFEFERKDDKNNPSPIQFKKLSLLKGRDGEKGDVRVKYDMRRSSITQDSVLSGFAYENEDDSDYPEDSYDTGSNVEEI
jgi:archaellum biogenesis ATPase FlaH